MGPSTVALKDVYARAKAAGKFKMTQQPDMKHTWNTMVASSYWDMRLASECGVHGDRRGVPEPHHHP